MTSSTFIERVVKIVSDAQAATTTTSIPSGVTDYAVALRDRFLLLNDMINANPDLMPEGFVPIEDFAEVPPPNVP